MQKAGKTGDPRAQPHSHSVHWQCLAQGDCLALQFVLGKDISVQFNKGN